jgi:hypothetical protein
VGKERSSPEGASAEEHFFNETWLHTRYEGTLKEGVII